MDETDLPEAWELAKGILAGSAHPEILSKAHELLARCTELEDNPDGALPHYRAAEEVAAEGHYYVQAARTACTLAMLHAEREDSAEAVDAFLRGLEYWERLDLDHEHPGMHEVRKKLDKAFKTAVKRKFTYPDKWSRAKPYVALRQMWQQKRERDRKATKEFRMEPDFDPSRSPLERLCDYHGPHWSSDREDPEQIAMLIDSVLSSSSDPTLEGYAWSAKIWLLKVTHADTEEQLEALRAAEAAWSETEFAEMALESIAGQVELHAEAGQRSEALDAFVRGVDYWSNLEQVRPWPRNEGYRDNSGKRYLEEAFKAVSNRGLRERTRDAHLEHCRQTGQDPVPPLPEAWQVEVNEA
jgi:tetratricopeptide (TPR) repeat protein